MPSRPAPHGAPGVHGLLPVSPSSAAGVPRDRRVRRTSTALRRCQLHPETHGLRRPLVGHGIISNLGTVHAPRHPRQMMDPCDPKPRAAQGLYEPCPNLARKTESVIDGVLTLRRRSGLCSAARLATLTRQREQPADGEAFPQTACASTVRPFIIRHLVLPASATQELYPFHHNPQPVVRHGPTGKNLDFPGFFRLTRVR
jgi:hypothetical protein